MSSSCGDESELLAIGIVPAAKKPTKFCWNCYHRRTGTSANYLEVPCYAPENTDKSKINLITGEHPKYYEYAVECRQFQHLCGPDGKWFVSRADGVNKYYPKLPSETPSVVRNKQIAVGDL